VNTSSLTAGSARQGQATELRAQARQLHERLARRAGLALLAWTRRQDERRSHEAVHLHRHTARAAERAYQDQYRLATTFATPLA
jgi:hypothetical protein